MYMRVMRRPPGSRRRPVELSKEAEANVMASISATATVSADRDIGFAPCRGCVAKKMCKESSSCMYGPRKPKENANAKNGRVQAK